MILISDPPFAWRIFLVLFCIDLAIIGSQFDGDDHWKGILFGSRLSLAFLYDSLSLQRVKIDLRDRVVYQASLNPVENLVNYLLKRPSKIPFKNIDKIYSDYTEVFGGATQRYYAYIRTSDPHKLLIGTFKKESEARGFATYLNGKVRQ